MYRELKLHGEAIQEWVESSLISLQICQKIIITLTKKGLGFSIDLKGNF